MNTQGVVATIAEQEWLEPVEKNLQEAVQKAFRSGGPPGQRIKNFMHGTWTGHPLHVILTDVPIGAWTAGLIFDVLDLMLGRDAFRTAADSSISIGVVSALGAAATGLTDWQDIDPPARRIGLVHATLNVSSVGLFTASLLTRRKSRGAGRRHAAHASHFVVEIVSANLVTFLSRFSAAAKVELVFNSRRAGPMLNLRCLSLWKRRIAAQDARSAFRWKSRARRAAAQG